MSVAKPRVASQRAERVEVYRDPETKLLLKTGPDHGTEERAKRDGGISVGDSVMGLKQTAWAVAPGAIELLASEGGLGMKLSKIELRWDIIRRRIEAAETLRGLATRAGVQKRLTGRYDFGFGGGGEMSDKALKAFDRLTALAERMTWSRLGPLLDLVLFDNLPPGLRYPTVKRMPIEDEPEFAAYEHAVRHNPAFVAAMRAAVERSEREAPARYAVWADACGQVCELLDQLADAFGLRLPGTPQ